MNIKIAETNKEVEHAFQVRTDVFVHEQNVPTDIELDAYDEEAIHFVGYESEVPVAAGRLRFVDDYGKLERICVLKDRRGKSYGKQIIEQMEDNIAKRGFSKAKLNAQSHAIDFYKYLGYEVVSKEFMDAGIPHVTMVKNLS